MLLVVSSIEEFRLAIDACGTIGMDPRGSGDIDIGFNAGNTLPAFLAFML